METLNFSIEGEFITDIARSWFWEEDKDYEIVENLLLSCLVTDEISLDEKKQIIREIIEGKKKLVGINTFTLEDDNVKIRPITDKITQLKKILKVDEIKKDMENNPYLYVDIYSICINITDKEELKEMSKNDLVEYLALDECGELINEWYLPTQAGFWLFNEENLIFELNGGPLKEDELDDFFEKLFKYLDKKDYLSDDFKKRQNLCKKLKQIKNLESTTLPPYDENDYIFGEPELMYYKHPDNLLSEYGWINRFGEWYSCDFGGHTVKATTIVRGNEKILNDYKIWIDEMGHYEDSDMGNGITYKSLYIFEKNTNHKLKGNDIYEEYLKCKGYIKFHNPYGGECYPEYYLKPTKEQNDTMFKCSIKYGYKKIKGLEDE